MVLLKKHSLAGTWIPRACPANLSSLSESAADPLAAPHDVQRE